MTDGEESSVGPERDEPVRGRDRGWTQWLPSIFLVLAVLAGATGVVYWMLDRPSSNAVEIFLATPTPQPPPVAHVTGAVVSPGVYTLDLNSRVGDAIAAAGGALSSADVGALNLAELVVDGERIEVPVSLAAASTPDTTPDTSGDAPAAVADAPPVVTAATAGLVDLNSAGRPELESLPEIGPVRAQAIIDWRTANGRFESLDELREVPGIGSETVAAIRGLVTPR